MTLRLLIRGTQKKNWKWNNIIVRPPNSLHYTTYEQQNPFNIYLQKQWTLYLTIIRETVYVKNKENHNCTTSRMKKSEIQSK